MRYRRIAGSGVWHSEHLCSQWPLDGFEESEHPTIGKRCDECAQFDRIEKNRRREDHPSRGSWE